MVSRGHKGAVVNMSSVAGVVPSAENCVYCMTKSALDMMTKCMALELGKHQASLLIMKCLRVSQLMNRLKINRLKSPFKQYFPEVFM